MDNMEQNKYLDTNSEDRRCQRDRIVSLESALLDIKRCIESTNPSTAQKHGAWIIANEALDNRNS